MERYSYTEDAYGNGEYLEAYDDAYAYEDYEEVYDEVYGCTPNCTALDGACTDYREAYTSANVYGDTEYSEDYHDAQDSLDSLAMHGYALGTPVAQANKAYHQPSSLDALRISTAVSTVSFVASEMRACLRQAFSECAPHTIVAYPAVPSVYPNAPYMTQPSVSQASQARPLEPSAYSVGSVNAQTCEVVSPPIGVEVSREAVEQSDISPEVVNLQLPHLNAQSCILQQQSPQPTPSSSASRTFIRKRSYSWSGFSCTTMVSTHTQTENIQLDPQVDTESGFGDANTNDSYGQDSSFDSPVEPTTMHIRTYAEVVKGVTDSKKRVHSKNSVALD